MRVVFMGTPAAAVPSLRRLLDDGHDVAAVYTQPDRPSGRHNAITFSPVKQLAMEHGLSILQPLRIKTPEALEEFRAHAADLVVVVAYGRILPDAFLKAFPLGAINVHFSLLPKYRGAAPVNWAIVRGETTTGVTTMLMDAGLDTGPILLQREVAIDGDENAIDLMARLSDVGASLLAGTLGDLDRLEPVAQDDAHATFAPILKREDGTIDWRQPAESIARRVRGFQPFPTSFTFFDGGKITLWKTRAGEDLETPGRPGQIVAAAGDDLIVSCGDKTLLYIDEVQAEGKRRMTARDFLNGGRLTVGDTLG